MNTRDGPGGPAKPRSAHISAVRPRRAPIVVPTHPQLGSTYPMVVWVWVGTRRAVACVLEPGTEFGSERQRDRILECFAVRFTTCMSGATRQYTCNYHPPPRGRYHHRYVPQDAKKEPKRGVFHPWAYNTDLLYSTIDLKIEELLLESKIRIGDGT